MPIVAGSDSSACCPDEGDDAGLSRGLVGPNAATEH
jgi:hypothetical protein